MDKDNTSKKLGKLKADIRMDASKFKEAMDRVNIVFINFKEALIKLGLQFPDKEENGNRD